MLHIRVLPIRGASFVSTWFALGITLGAIATARAQPGTLYPESFYDNERCLPPCACAQGRIEGRLYGTYTLTLVNIGDVFDFYTIDNAQFFLHAQGVTLNFQGSGDYRHSAIANLQAIHLSLSRDNGTGAVELESGIVPLEVHLPAIRIDLANTTTPCQTFALHFVGGPIVSCPIDFDDGGVLGIPDDAVDINDLLYFLAVFEGGSEAADLVGGPCDCVDCVCPDGAVDINDLLFFLRRFERGC